MANQYSQVFVKTYIPKEDIDESQLQLLKDTNFDIEENNGFYSLYQDDCTFDFEKDDPIIGLFRDVIEESQNIDHIDVLIMFTSSKPRADAHGATALKIKADSFQMIDIDSFFCGDLNLELINFHD